jgi:hypothetical protein
MIEGLDGIFTGVYSSENGIGSLLGLSVVVACIAYMWRLVALHAPLFPIFSLKPGYRFQEHNMMSSKISLNCV